jgi:CMP/dCMP kinase
MKNKISITGDLGSGKSVVGRILAQKLNIPTLSTGAIQRKIAERLEMTTLQLNQYTDTHPEIDDEIDDVFKSMNTNPDSYLLDSRLAWFFIPDSFKVYLQVSVAVAAERIMNDKGRKSEGYASVQEAISDLTARKASENQRFLRVYGADCGNLKNFDLVINTQNVSPEKVAEMIIHQFQKYQQGEPIHHHWIANELPENELVPW